MGEYLACFKAYDVRGKVPSELNIEIAYNIGRAYADETGANSVCVGYDIRSSGPELAKAITRALTDAGVDVIDLGMVGTEMMYFATGHYEFDGGIMITASHNPPEYNGMKMVRSEAKPISGDSGLNEIEIRAWEQNWIRTGQGGNIIQKDVYPDFVQHLLKFCNPATLKPLRILASAGNGAAGLAMEALQPHLPLQVTPLHFRPDGSFPVGVPNPILPESRAEAEQVMREGSFDFGVAWDGDYDRCFFFDEKGNFIEGYYIVGLLAKALLAQSPGEVIIHDPRLIWNTLDVVEKAGGKPVMSKTGHAFIKERMRKENAVYGGEMSAHHYFRDHWYCDSGMIPMLLIAQLVSDSGRTLGDLVGEMIANFPCSGEINSVVDDPQVVIDLLLERYGDGEIDKTDGVCVAYQDWRFNLRASNTEPVIRLNVESRGDRALLEEKTAELLSLIRG